VAAEARESRRIWAGRAAAEAWGRRGAAGFGKHRCNRVIQTKHQADLSVFLIYIASCFAHITGRPVGPEMTVLINNNMITNLVTAIDLTKDKLVYSSGSQVHCFASERHAR
jgi:hypothetical protein